MCGALHRKGRKERKAEAHFDNILMHRLAGSCCPRLSEHLEWRNTAAHQQADCGLCPHPLGGVLRAAHGLAHIE